MPSLYESLNPTEPALTCAHLSPKGKPCDRVPVEGETLCVLHGASVTRAKEAVQRRLVALQEKAITVHEEVLLGAFDDKTRLAAVIAVYDRTGLGPTSTIQVKDTEDLTTLTDDELAARADEASRRLRASKQRMNEDSSMTAVGIH